MVRILLSLILALFVAAPAAHALTVDEVEDAWANVGQVTGTFTEQYEDGSTSSGTFAVYGPTLIVLTYENGTVFAVNGGPSKKIGQVHAAGRQVTIIDGWNGEMQQFDLGPFKQLLSETPKLERVLTGTGESASLFTLRLQDPRAPKRGHIDITWSNQSGKMLRWHTMIDGSDVTTKFSY